MKRPMILLFSLLVFAVFAGDTYIWWHRAHTPTTKIAQDTPRAPSPGPAADPLTLADIRSRAYTGGPIQQTQDLGTQIGYHQSVVSFTSDGLTEYALQATPVTPAPAGGYPVIIL